MEKPSKKIYIYLTLIIAAALLVNSVTFAKPLAEGTPTYHFLIDGYIDELWLSLNADGSVNGYDQAPGAYYAPILGVWQGGKGMLLFIDFPTGIGSELMMMLVRFPSLSATGYFTTDGLSVDGPYNYQLIYVPKTEEAQGGEGPALAASGGSTEVNPAMVGYYLRPFIDEEWFDVFAPGMINGYADVTGNPGYPAPHLGFVAGGELIFADDYLTEPGLYELRLNRINIGTLMGTSYATVDGIDVSGPMDVWLEPMVASTTSNDGLKPGALK